MSQEQQITIQNISNIVKNKQKELNDIHDIQINQLEQLVEERNKLLYEATRKFNLLRDDFQFNLNLLEARDNEIIRLSQIEQNLLIDIESKERENKLLLNKIEKIQLKETENYQKYQNEKNKTKKILFELQEEFESLRWSTNEDMMLRNKEIEHLKGELNKSHIERKDALELQRVELTSTFENLLKEREQEFYEKEKEIAEQIITLENRFQNLSADNTRLKSELGTMTRKTEKLIAQLSEKEEKSIQLEWSISDKDKEKQDIEEKLYRKIQSLENELNSSSIIIEQMKVDYKRDMEKMKLELKREQEYSQLKIKHWEELYQNSCNEIDRFERQLESLQSNSHQYKKELETLRPKLIEYEKRESDFLEKMKKYENQMDLNEKLSLEKIITLEKSLKDIEIERVELLRENERLLRQIHEKEDIIRNNEKIAFDKLKESIESYERKLNELHENYEHQNKTNIELVKAELEADFITQMSDKDTEMIETISKFKEINEKLKSDINILKNEKKHFEELYEEEKTECSALKLRIQISNQQNQSTKLPQSFDINNNNGNNNNNNNNNNNFVNNNQKLRINTQTNGIAIPSPMFSDDMGVISIPPSPSVLFSPPGPSRYPSKQTPVLPPTLESTESSKQDFNFDDDLSSHFTVDNNHNNNNNNNNNGNNKTYSAILEENKNLKSIIREMRHDMESLQVEMSTLENEKQTHLNRIHELETRLQNATNDVNRLRNERKKLMDLNNELRANFHMQQLENNKLQETMNQLKSDDVNNDVNNNNDLRDSINSPEKIHENPNQNNYRSNPKFNSSRETISQEMALQKLKEKSAKLEKKTQQQLSKPPNRKVINYAQFIT